MEIISREKYVDSILRYIGKGLIIALTGQRRVGKSYIMRQLANEIKGTDMNANIIYINKEKKKFDSIMNSDDLWRYLDDKLDEDRNNYLLIDEVQDIAGFEHVLRSLNADEECRIVVTGSNAMMLSSELSTYI